MSAESNDGSGKRPSAPLISEMRSDLERRMAALGIDQSIYGLTTNRPQQDRGLTEAVRSFPLTRSDRARNSEPQAPDAPHFAERVLGHLGPKTSGELVIEHPVPRETPES